MSNKKPTEKESANRRQDGKFAPGNKLGKSWQKGQSGNPKGRPKARTLSEAYREALNQPLPNDPKKTYADAVAEALCRDAAAGNVIAAKELADRTEGRPRQAIDVTIEQKKRELVNAAIEQLMAEAGIEREEAIEQLTTLAPEVSELIH